MIKTLLTLVLLVFLTAFTAQAGTDVTLAWDTSDGATGYKLFYGISSRNYTTTIDVKNVLQYTVRNLADGTNWYFAATAYDQALNESDFSDEVSYTTGDTTPPPRPGMRIISVVKTTTTTTTEVTVNP